MNQEILNKFLRCKTSESEDKTIMDWLDESPENQKELNFARTLFESMALVGSKVNDLPMIEPRRTLTLRRVINYTMTAAAIIICMLASTYTFIQYDRQQWASQLLTLEAPKGQRVNIKLQDGTFVQLNSGAKLEYPTAFVNDIRKIRLSGEAFFNVKHSAEQPFVVETFACDVEVLGTEFNLSADEKYNTFSTVLVNGSVKVTNLKSQQEMIMKPNDIVNLENGALTLSQVDNNDMYCWTEGQLLVDNLSFDQLMYKFERAYDVKIVMQCQVEPTIKNLSGKLRLSDGIEHALQMVKMATDFNYTYNEDDNLITIK